MALALPASRRSKERRNVFRHPCDRSRLQVTAGGQADGVPVIRSLAVVISCLALAACGDDEPVETQPIVPEASTAPGTEDPGPEGEPNVNDPGFNEEGEEVTLDGVTYRSVVARQLNPRARPDQTYVGGAQPGAGNAFFGVFVSACNATDEPVETADDVALVAGDGETVQPAGVADEAFAYAGGTAIDPEQCVPQEGTVGDEGVPGALVVFEVPARFPAARPLFLQVTDGGEVTRIRLDV